MAENIVNVVVNGLVSVPQRGEVWCAEKPLTITVRSATSPQLEVVQQIVVNSKCMPSLTSALCLCLTRTGRLWSSWTSGHLVVIDVDTRLPVDYVSFDRPHPIHSLRSAVLGNEEYLVALALDGHVTLWDPRSKAVLSSHAITVGSKCPIMQLPFSKPGVLHYYAGFDDGSIRCFSVRISSRSSSSPLVEYVGSRSFFDVHEGSVLCLECFVYPKESVKGKKRLPSLVLWSGGEDGQLRQTEVSSLSSAATTQTLIPRQDDGVYHHKLCRCGGKLLSCSSDGTLSIFEIESSSLLQRVQFPTPLCVRELVGLRVNDSPRILLALSDGSLRLLTLKTDDNVFDQPGIHSDIPDSSFLPFESPRSPKLSAGRSSSPRTNVMQRAFEVVARLRFLEEDEEAERDAISHDFGVGLRFIEDVQSYAYWGPVLGRAQHPAVQSGLETRWLEEKLRHSQTFFLQREELLLQGTRKLRDMTHATSKADVLAARAEDFRVETLARHSLEWELACAELGQCTYRSLLEISSRRSDELDRLVTELREEVATQETFLQEMDEFRQNVADASELRKTMSEQLKQEKERVQTLEKVVAKQKDKINELDADAILIVEEQMRTQVHRIQDRETCERWRIEVESYDFWINQPFVRILQADREDTLLKYQASSSTHLKQVQEIARWRTYAEELERELHYCKSHDQSCSDQVRRIDSERRCLEDEIAQYKMQMKQLEAEIAVMSRHLSDAEMERRMCEDKLASTLQLAEDSCQTVSDQRSIIKEVRDRSQALADAIDELVARCNAQLVSGIDAPRLVQCRGLLRDAMYELATLRRRTFSDDSNEPLDAAFEKLRFAVEKCLDPALQEFIIFDRSFIQGAVDQVVSVRSR